MKQKQHLYLSFVEEDLEAFKKFRKHLSLLEDQGLIEIWSREKVLPGGNVTEEVKANLLKANMIVFVVSIELLTDPDIRKVELKIALQQVKKKGTKILPVLYRRCAWTLSELGKFSHYPKNGKFIDLWENKDDAWTTVVEEIHELIEEKE